MANDIDYIKLVDNMLKDKHISIAKRSTILQLIQKMNEFKQGKNMAYADSNEQPYINLGYSRFSHPYVLEQPAQSSIPYQPRLNEILNKRDELSEMFQNRMKNSFSNLW